MTLLDSLSPSERRWLWVGLSGATLGMSLWLDSLGAALRTPAAPAGIVSFELARTAAASGAMLVSWSAAAREAAHLIQGLDYLFLLLYPAWFSLCCASLARRFRGGSRRVASGLAVAVWACAPLDAVENLGLIRQLVDGPSDTWAWIAWACAIPKFALVAVAALFVLGGGLVVLWRLVRGKA